MDLRLPTSECPKGYPIEQAHQIVGESLVSAFNDWMRGQTVLICSGTRFNHDTKRYERDCPDPHGDIVFPWDLERFAQGRHLPPLD